MLLIDLPRPPSPPDLGVIREARRRRRRRLATVALAAVAAALGVLVLAAGGRTPARQVLVLDRASSPGRLRGPTIHGATHLRLITESDGVPAIVNVDRGTVALVRGLGVTPHARYIPWGPAVSLSPAPGGALAVVARQACEHCAAHQVLFALGADGSSRRLATLTLSSADSSTPDPGSAAEWVLARGRGGRCTLRLLPSARPPLAAPCGTLEADTPSGLAIATARGTLFVTPRSGPTREPPSVRARPAGQLSPLPGGLALESSGIPGSPSGFALVKLATGVRTPLRWPSAVRYGYDATPQRSGPLVAVTFIDPYDARSHAPVVDVWVLDTRTAAFTHVPGFPAAEDFKQSGLAWAPGNRLVLASQIQPPAGRAVIAIWRPGDRTLALRAVPVAPDGYYTFIPVFD